MRYTPDTAHLTEYLCAYCGEDARRVQYGWLKCKLCNAVVCTRHMDDHYDVQHGVTDLFTTVAKKE